MSKQLKADDWGPISVRTSPRIRRCLQRLVSTGLYGSTIEEAAEHVLMDKIRNDIIAEKWPLHSERGYL